MKSAFLHPFTSPPRSGPLSLSLAMTADTSKDTLEWVSRGTGSGTEKPLICNLQRTSISTSGQDDLSNTQPITEHYRQRETCVYYQLDKIKLFLKPQNGLERISISVRSDWMCFFSQRRVKTDTTFCLPLTGDRFKPTHFSMTCKQSQEGRILWHGELWVWWAIHMK